MVGAGFKDFKDGQAWLELVLKIFKDGQAGLELVLKILAGDVYRLQNSPLICLTGSSWRCLPLVELSCDSLPWIWLTIGWGWLDKVGWS